MRPDDPLRTVFMRMRAADVSQLPVVDGDRIVGLVDESDMLGAVLEGSARAFELPVKDVMVTRLETISGDALIRTWPRLREWINANRKKLRARAAVVQAKAEWEHQERRDDLLLPSGFQLERARTLLADPGDLAVADVQDYIALSSAREESQRQERDEALAIAAAQARTARLQRITRWAFAAVGAITLIALATIGYLQWDKARQLAASVGSLIHTQANVLAALSSTKLLGGEIDSALRLASRGASIDLALPSDTVKDSPAGAAVAAAVSHANWRFALHDGRVASAAFSPDGSRIVTASGDGTARIWDAATGKEIVVLRSHDAAVTSAAFSSDGSRIVTASDDKTARIWDARLETMSAKGLLAEACARLKGLTTLTRDEMRLAGYPDTMPEIDVCR